MNYLCINTILLKLFLDKIIRYEPGLGDLIYKITLPKLKLGTLCIYRELNNYYNHKKTKCYFYSNFNCLVCSYEFNEKQQRFYYIKKIYTYGESSYYIKVDRFSLKIKN